MRHIWKYIYLCWALICVIGGYRMLAPGRTAYFNNIDRSFIAELVIFWLGAPLLITALNCWFYKDQVKFIRPSLDRSPFGGGRDPLQGLRLMVASIILMFGGACFALSKTDHNGVRMFWSGLAASVAFFIGERLVYWVYAKKIANPPLEPTVK